MPGIIPSGSPRQRLGFVSLLKRVNVQRRRFKVALESRIGFRLRVRAVAFRLGGMLGAGTLTEAWCVFHGLCQHL